MPRITFTITPLSNVDMDERRVLDLNQRHRAVFDLNDKVRIINLLCDGDQDVQTIRAVQLNTFDHLLLLGDRYERPYKVLTSLMEDKPPTRAEMYAQSFAR